MSDFNHRADARDIAVDVRPAEDLPPQVIDPTVPVIYIDDLAARRGDGIFETLMVRGGRVRNLDLHRERFVRGAALLDLPAPDVDRWLQATDMALTAWEQTGGGEASLRWMYSRGRESTGEVTGWVTVTAESASVVRQREEGVRVMTAHRGFSLSVSADSPWALVGAKTLSYAMNMAALRYAASQGLDDVIFIGDDDRVLEGPTSTVVAVTGRTLSTPVQQAGVLPGTTQAAMFALARDRGWETEEKPLTVADLRAADGVWLVSSVRVHARVTEMDGVAMPRPDVAAEVEALAVEAATA
ncbi:aminodeoxychorismate lyase [Corynebacterium sp.]|mgnify:CR=1 FL=1|jgi:4-amino-4-deoxychorismate lyase|uniref:aminodeoxychorismate lyase n=1 Tax=Corynebacterium sp. TaxID=1720 RepID=UPI0025BF9A8C|nr:aminodeoxychorismate lyase [Corynebacterium sp.]